MGLKDRSETRVLSCESRTFILCVQQLRCSHAVDKKSVTQITASAVASPEQHHHRTLPQNIRKRKILYVHAHSPTSHTNLQCDAILESLRHGKNLFIDVCLGYFSPAFISQSQNQSAQSALQFLLKLSSSSQSERNSESSNN